MVEILKVGLFKYKLNLSLLLRVKKFLLSFTTIILFTIPSVTISSEEVTLYRWETSDGKVWKTFGDKDSHDQYKGEVDKTNGKLYPWGLGILTWLDGSKYVGEFIDGDPFGKGIYYHKDGSIFKGEFYRDLTYSIIGTKTLGKYRYEGNFSNFKLSGKGKKYVLDELMYEGEFLDGKYHGYGKYSSSYGTYEGEFKNGERDGQGTLILHGVKYVGDFKNGNKHGMGVESYKESHQTDDFCKGEWRDDWKYKVKYFTKEGRLYREENHETKEFIDYKE